MLGVLGAAAGIARGVAGEWRVTHDNRAVYTAEFHANGATQLTGSIWRNGDEADGAIPGVDDFLIRMFTVHMHTETEGNILVGDEAFSRFSCEAGAAGEWTCAGQFSSESEYRIALKNSTSAVSVWAGLEFSAAKRPGLVLPGSGLPTGLWALLMLGAAYGASQLVVFAYRRVAAGSARLRQARTKKDDNAVNESAAQ